MRFQRRPWRSVLLFVGCCLTTRIASGQGANLELILDVSEAGQVPQQVLVLATKDGTGAVAVELTAPGKGRLSLPVPGEWRVQVTSEVLWSPPLVASAPGKQRISLRPASLLTGTLLLPRGSELAEPLTLRVTPCGALEPLGDSVCVVSKGAAIRCPAPAGCSDLRLRSRGFVSHYLWNQTLPSRSALNLGDLTFRPGASVVGWVQTEDSRPFDASTSVELLPQSTSAGASGPQPDKRIATQRLQARPTARGFFEIDGVEPGAYFLEARQEGYSAARASNVQVKPGIESALRHPLVLSHPRRATFQVSPPLTAEGGRWQLELVRARPEGLERLPSTNCDDSGSAEVTSLAPGHYFVQVTSADRSQKALATEIDIESADSFWPLDVNLIAVRGLVKLGDEPLGGARLVFGGSTGRESFAVTTDVKGRFEGAVTREGRWVVEIQSTDPSVHRVLRRVEVRRVLGRSYARVELTLPDLTLAGVVVDEEFVPQRAQVDYRPEGADNDPTVIVTDRDGIFEERGLPPGRLELWASTKEGESDALQVVLSEGIESEPLQVVVRKRRELRGLVRDALGPVIGATVMLRDAGRSMDRGDEVTTGVDGRFAAKLIPAQLTVASVNVTAPGRAMYLTRRSLPPPGEDLVLDLAREGGAVELSFPPQDWDWLLLVRGGASTWYGILRSWASLHADAGGSVGVDRLAVPQLEPGEWSACLVEPGSAEWLSVAGMGSPVKGRCLPFMVSPGSRSALDLRPAR